MQNIGNSNTACIGCGICAGVCDCIKVNFDGDRYIPEVDEELCIECGKCKKVCSFCNNIKNTEKATIKNKKIGNYISCGIGRNNQYVSNSASGGLLSAFIRTLLENNIVDAVVTVAANYGNEPLYKYEIIENELEIVQSAGSAYYPVNITEILNLIKGSEKTYAIVGLPCFIRNLKMLREQDLRFNNIKILIGLACGGLPKASLLSYAMHGSGIDLQKLHKISFRFKRNGVACNKYILHLEDDEIKKEYCFTNSRGKLTQYGAAYLNKAFVHESCLVCDDATAEYADISFMDAWLPQYNDEILGTSMYIVRTEIADNVIDIMKKEENNYLQVVDASEVIRAQENVNLIQFKKIESFYRKKWIKKTNIGLENESPLRVSLKRKVKLQIKGYMQVNLVKKTEKYWNMYKNGNMTFETLQRKIEKLYYYKG